MEQCPNQIQAQVLIRQLFYPLKPIFTGKWNSVFTQQKTRTREQKHKWLCQSLHYINFKISLGKTNCLCHVTSEPLPPNGKNFHVLLKIQHFKISQPSSSQIEGISKSVKYIYFNTICVFVQSWGLYIDFWYIALHLF